MTVADTDRLVAAEAGSADIVVGVDGSDESFAALRWALREAALADCGVNAVFGWTHSWDAGSKPDSDDAWNQMRHRLADQLRQWVEAASENIDFDPTRLRLTSVRASGTQALLQLGADARQIVVGRRSLGRVARWFTGSLSASLAESAEVPVTVVRIADGEEERVEDDIAEALAPGAHASRRRPRSAAAASSDAAGQHADGARRPVAVGVDGSDSSLNALRFAIAEARLHQVPLHVLFCWQLKDLGVIAGYENAIAPLEAGEKRASELLDDLMATVDVPHDLDTSLHVFHISAAKGLISASRYASHLVVGSRGLNGMDAHFLGSVSRQIVNFAECTVTVVH